MADNDSWDFVSEFTLAEIREMENIYKTVGEDTLHKDFCQNLATDFSCSENRVGKSPVTWQQVQMWFQAKQMETEAKQVSSQMETEAKQVSSQMETEAKQVSSPMALELFVDLSGENPNELFVDLSGVNPNKPPERVQRRKGTVDDIKELSYEARSSKDHAWYDVESFLNYRILSTGELEVRVRYAGFDKSEDEWVNVENGLRERSIPLEPSECEMVKIGDPVLCYQDREHYQVYCDAVVVDLLRRSHDDKRCKCIFFVCYDNDDTEEEVTLERMCRRPSQ